MDLYQIIFLLLYLNAMMVLRRFFRFKRNVGIVSLCRRLMWYFYVFFYCFCFIKSLLFTFICNEIAFVDSYIPIVSYPEYANWLFADDQVFRCVMAFFFFYFRTGSNRWRQRKVKTYYIIYSGINNNRYTKISITDR